MARSEYSVGKTSEQTVYTEPDISNMIEDLKFQIRSLKDAIEDHEKDGDNRVYEDIDSSRSRRRRRVGTANYLLKYSIDMGFHWMRFILQSHVGVISRLTWFLVLIVCLALVSYQITDRVMKFLSDATHTNMDLHYVESMEYPTITICNLNKYRITEANKTELYSFLHDVVHGKKDRRGLSFTQALTKTSPLNKSYSDFMRQMSHRKECFVHSCTWAGRPCGIQNFTEIFTDYGLCYKFSPSSRKIKSGGTASGLSVVLNVEQYEYLLGPRSAVGVKFAIHDPSDHPQLSTTGYFAPVGSHSSVSITKVQHFDKSTDGDRWGLSQFHNPHPEARYAKGCLHRCEAQHWGKRCKCGMPWMIRYGGGNLTECSANEYFRCIELTTDFRKLHSALLKTPAAFGQRTDTKQSCSLQKVVLLGAVANQRNDSL
ncbi:acid-sensing ion channel 5-like [Liolophura sinensis]|uniref:acid-sensing ion channel 5-like n=1 Tax=Liolophura sinensis TaxID=3198878 RepID=UPI00315952BA